MPATSRNRTRFRFALAPAALLALALALTAHAQPPEAPKKSLDPPAPVVKLPDGTFLWLGTPTDANGERVSLTPQELQKYLDQIDQLKKQLAARKPTPPSGCAIRARVEKRGDQSVAALKLTYSFRTTQPQTAVALGGRKGFLVAAALDGNNLPVLDPAEDGFAVLVETAGEHLLVVHLEAPVTARGAKSELGFEIGLPRAAITTLLLDPPASDTKRVILTTRTTDPGPPARPPEVRRTPVDLKQLAPQPGHENGHPLGAVDSLEVTWEPPAAAAQPADQVQSAEVNVAVVLTEGVVETTAKFTLRGPAREWKLVAPATADLSADRTGADVGPTLPAVVTKPADPNKAVWKVEFPAGSAASEWVVTAVTRQPRPKPEDAKHRGPFAVGPFTALDVLRQTGTVRVTAGPHAHFAFKHGPDLRRSEPGGPAEDDRTEAFFRLTTGPTGSTPVNSPLFTVEARPQEGTVRVTPTYRLTLTEAGWRVRAEVKVSPIRKEVGTVAVDVPAGWRGLEASPPELVEGVQQGEPREGFWAAAAASFAGGLRVPVVVHLAAAHKQPFDLVLTATVPIEPGDTAATVPLPRFPGAVEWNTSVTATVPEGLEVRGEIRDRAGEYAAWATPLGATTDPTGKTTRAVTTVGGKSEVGLSRVTLAWNPYRPELSAVVRTDVTLGDRQMGVAQHIALRSPEGLPRALRFRGPASPAALKTVPPLDPAGPGEWTLTPPADAKEMTITITFALPLPPAPDTPAPAEVPVVALWPTGATRAESTVRVWSLATTGRTIAPKSPGWREVPAEPAPERDALPALTLTATGFEPLVLETRPAADVGAVIVWAERGLVEAWGADDGTTSYRARFLLRRWLSPSVAVRLPAVLAGPNPEFLRDGQRVDAAPVPGASADGRAYRVPLPAAKPGATTVIEVRYQLPAARGPAGETVYHPPGMPGVAFAGPVRWQVTVPEGSVPLLTAGASAEFRWRLRPVGMAPAPAASAESLDWWFRTGEEIAGEAGGSGVTARQSSPAPVTVYRVPRTGLVIAGSVAAFVLILVVSRLPGSVVGPTVALAAAAAGAAAVLYPHPAAQAAGACQPGVAAAAGVLLLLAGARWLYRRRITRMPGFSQVHPEPLPSAGPVPSSNRKRPSGVGSAERAPVAPSG